MKDKVICDKCGETDKCIICDNCQIASCKKCYEKENYKFYTIFNGLICEQCLDENVLLKSEFDEVGED